VFRGRELVDARCSRWRWSCNGTIRSAAMDGGSGAAFAVCVAWRNARLGAIAVPLLDHGRGPGVGVISWARVPNAGTYTTCSTRGNEVELGRRGA
jgi:hypothetical protein